MQIIFYETATGAISYVTEYDDGTASTVIDADTDAGYDWIVGDGGADPSEDYVLSGVQTARPLAVADATVETVADGTTVLTLATSMPVGTVVDFQGTETTLAAIESVQFKTALVGPFEVLISPPFPYIEAVVQISAVSA